VVHAFVGLLVIASRGRRSGGEGRVGAGIGRDGHTSARAVATLGASPLRGLAAGFLAAWFRARCVAWLVPALRRAARRFTSERVAALAVAASRHLLRRLLGGSAPALATLLRQPRLELRFALFAFGLRFGQRRAALYA
jgi:hypothetical protein